MIRSDVVDEQREIHDAIVVGAGPGGLTAAVYFGRFRRRCVVLEDDQPRARWIPTSHNIPGFTTGIGGEEFLTTLKEQALQYGAQVRRAHVSALTDNGGIFTLQTEEGMFSSRYVLLATGVRDHLPDIDGASEAVKRGLLRVCPVCDAFEAIDKRIAVIGDGALGEREADFLKNYSDQVALLEIASSIHAPAKEWVNSQRLERIPISLSDLKIKDDRVTLSSARGEREFDVVYLALGCSPQHDLARSLQAACDDHGALRVNGHQETSVPRLYAAGDVVRGLNQVIVAASESAIAATDIHNKLRAT
jgi:thioredoxin reductase (NADPH)